MNSHSLSERIHREPAFFWLTALLCLIPVFIADFPAGSDLPQHGAQISLAIDLLGKGQWSELLGFYLATPYLLTYAAGAILFLLSSPVIALKLLVAIAMLGYLFAARTLVKSYGSDVKLSWLAFFGCYSFSYQWGFLPFNVSICFGLLLIAVTYKNNAEGKKLLTVPETLLIVCITLTHGLTSLIMAGFMFSRVLVSRSKSVLARSLITGLLLLLPTLAWNLFSQNGIAGTNSGLIFGYSPLTSAYFFYQQLQTLDHTQIWGWGRLSGFFPRLLGISEGLLATATGLLILALPFLAGYRLTKDIQRRYAFLVATGVLIFVPTGINSAVFVSERFALLMPCFYALMFDRERDCGFDIAKYVGLLCILLIVLLQTHRSLTMNQEWRALSSAVNTAPRNLRALYINYDHPRQGQLSPPFLHAGQWYGVLRDGLVDPNFSATYFQPVRYRDGHMPGINMSSRFEWEPTSMSWSRISSDNYQLFIIRGNIHQLEEHSGCKVNDRVRQHENWLVLQARDISC